MTAVVVYDWLLTFPNEARLVWGRKVTSANVLHLANRFIFLISCVTELVADFALGVTNTVSNYGQFRCDDMSPYSVPAEVCKEYHDYLEC